MTPLARIKTWTPPNEEMKDCWSRLVRGIDAGMLVDEELSDLLEHLDQRRDLILEELAFEFLGPTLRVRFLGETGTCSPDELIGNVRAALVQRPEEAV